MAREARSASSSDRLRDPEVRAGCSGHRVLDVVPRHQAGHRYGVRLAVVMPRRQIQTEQVKVRTRALVPLVDEPIYRRRPR
ncbi:hypothetical protein OB08_12990 [Microbacterium sp. HJ5]